ncbi:hypothetical protein K443DRAFT_117698, partial [Laccaria amethystina LaAM-08-1]
NWMAQTSANTKDFIVDLYDLSNHANGIRSFPYSTSAVTNPLRHSSLQKLTALHDIGEVWANMLHQVYAALVAARVFSNKKLTDANGKEGNIVFMKVMMNALPVIRLVLVQARNAILQADQNKCNGANRCIIAKEGCAFRRGCPPWSAATKVYDKCR